MKSMKALGPVSLMKLVSRIQRRYPRTMGLPAVIVVLLTFGTFTAPAFAAAPEAPVTGAASAVTNTSAVLNGELNPKNAGDPGSYEFLYRPSATECQEGVAAPVPAGVAGGVKGEAVKTEVTGLEPGTRYTVCLVAAKEAEETVAGNPVSFTTTASAPVISEETFVSVGSSTAVLFAKINPERFPACRQVQYRTCWWTMRILDRSCMLCGCVAPRSGCRAGLTGFGVSHGIRFLVLRVSGESEPPPKTDPATLSRPKPSVGRSRSPTNAPTSSSRTPPNREKKTPARFSFPVSQQHCHRLLFVGLAFCVVVAGHVVACCQPGC
jgi:hypothetical protein